MSDCRNELANAGLPAPRTCPTCGIAGGCARGVPLAVALRPDELRAAVDAEDGPAFLAAVSAVNASLRRATDDGGRRLMASVLGPTGRVRDRVLKHFRNAGWTVRLYSNQLDGDDYVFEG